MKFSDIIALPEIAFLKSTEEYPLVLTPASGRQTTFADNVVNFYISGRSRRGTVLWARLYVDGRPHHMVWANHPAQPLSLSYPVGPEVGRIIEFRIETCDSRGEWGQAFRRLRVSGDIHDRS